MSTDKDFLDLLNSLAEEEQYTIEFSRLNADPIPVKFKSLTTVQLKELVKTAVDSPLTQSVFNCTATKVFKESILSAPSNIQFNVVDRLLFLLETRIQTISPTKTIKNENKQIDSLKSSLKTNATLFAPSTSKTNKISITYGVGLIDTEVQIEEEIYKNVEVKIDNVEELRKIVGEAFINEIAKSIHSVTIEDKTINLSQVSFKKRLKIVETLPASLIQKVVEYVEAYKNVVNAALTVKEFTIPIDSTLFSV
jgi:hypothetical protein